MSDRFACLKESTPSNKTNGGTRFNSNKNNNNRFKSNQFNQRKSHNRRNNDRRNNDRRNYRRDCSNNYQPQKKYSKMLEQGSLVGRGEVSFTPEYKCGKQTQKERKQQRKQEKLKVINKKNEKDNDWKSLQNDEDIALTMAMAEKYQYFTESEEEEEDYEHDPLLPDTDLV
jgi:hypothetical protein